MAGAVVISGFGALNGWTLICAEMPLAAAKDGLFPDGSGACRKRGSRRSASSPPPLLASVAMVHQLPGQRAAYTVFNTLVFMSGITAAIPYGFSALAQIKWRLQDNRRSHTPRFVRDVDVAVVALVFSLAVHLVLAQHRRQPWHGVWLTVHLQPASPSCSASRSTWRSATRMTEPAPPVPAVRDLTGDRREARP